LIFNHEQDAALSNSLRRLGELRWGDVALGQNAANFFPLNLIGLLGSLTSSFGNFNQNA
jgi:hypothetical protein